LLRNGKSISYDNVYRAAIHPVHVTNAARVASWPRESAWVTDSHRMD